MSNELSKIRGDINRCSMAIAMGEIDRVRKLHDELISIYSGVIPSLKKGLDKPSSWMIGKKDVDYYGNLKKIRSKLELYIDTIPNKKQMSENQIVNYYINSNQNVTSLNVDIKLIFNDVKKEIKSFNYMQQEEIKEIISKVDEIEDIVTSTESKSKKWSKLKGIITWLTSKGVDIALKILPLILEGLKQSK